jgi:hypothetical protein
MLFLKAVSCRRSSSSVRKLPQKNLAYYQRVFIDLLSSHGSWVNFIKEISRNKGQHI